VRRSITNVIGEGFEALWFVTYICAAAALVAIGPALWIRRLIATHRFGWAGCLAIVWLTSVAIVARDVWRKRISHLSIGLFLAWLVVLVWVFNVFVV
jgi:hypothetical protein